MNSRRIAFAFLALLVCTAGVLFVVGSRPTTPGHEPNVLQRFASRVVHFRFSRAGAVDTDIRRSPAKQRKAAAKPQPTRSDKQTSITLPGAVINEDGRPVSGARVEVRDSGESKAVRPVTTDAKGRFAIIGLAPGPHDIAAIHKDYVPVVYRFRLDPPVSPPELVIRLPLGATLTGRVSDEENQPISEVHVAARRRKMEQMVAGGDVYLDDASYKTSDTDTSGSFSVSGVGMGDAVLEFTRAGYESQTMDIKVGADTSRTPLKVILKRTGVIAGVVVDENNQPVTSAPIQLVRYRAFGAEGVELPKGKHSAMSGADGSFAFKRLFNEGFYDLRIEDPRYAPGVYNNVPAGSEQVTCVLQRGGEIRGRAEYIDRETTPARMILEVEATVSGTTFTAQSTSGENGEFAFDRLPYGRYRFGSASEGIALEPHPGAESRRQWVTSGILVQAYETCVAAGHVYEAETDSPVDNATVTVQAAYGPQQKLSRTFRTVTNSSGEFSFDRLPAGFHVVQAVAESLMRTPSGTSAQTVTLLRGEKRENIVLRLSHGGSVEGFVSDANGSRVEGADVQLYVANTGERSMDVKSLNARTDVTGYFRIWGIKVGDELQLYASARKEGYAKTRSPIIGLTAQKPDAVTQIVMTDGGGVAGRITDVEGNPVPLAQIRAVSREFVGDPSGSAVESSSGSDGTYLVGNCTPGKTRITVTCPGFVQQGREVTVTEGRVTQPVNFRLVRGNLISGRIATFEGKPLANAKVSARPLSGATGTGDAVSDKNGDYSIRDLGKGYFRIEASFTIKTDDGIQNYTFTLPRVASGTSTADIDCDVDNYGSGRIENEQNKGIDTFRLTLRSRTDTQPTQDFRFNLDRSYSKARGQYTILNLPRGVYSLQVTATGYETYREENLIVGPGKRTVFPTITLKSAGGLKGMVISSTTDRPVYNATVRLLDMSQPEFTILSKRELAYSSNREIVEIINPDVYNDQLDRNNENVPVAKVRTNVATSARTEYDGTFSVPGAPAGTYTVEIDHPDYAPVRVPDVRLMERTPTDMGRIYLDAGGSLVGQVIDDRGEPVYQAVIQLPGVVPRKEARTDPGGNYALRGIRPGQYTVKIRGTVHGRKSHSFAVVGISADQATVQDVRLDLMAILYARPSGAPAAASFSAQLYGVDYSGNVHSDIYYDAPFSSGMIFGQNIPSGRYWMRIGGTSSGVTFWRQQIVELGWGENQVWFNFPTARFAGRVLREDTGAAGVTVQLMPEVRGVTLPNSIYQGLMRSGKTNSTGAFNIRNLQEGSYRVAYGGVAAPPANLAPGQAVTGITLTLP